MYISSTPLTHGSPSDPARGFAPAVAEMGGWQIRPHWGLDLVTVVDPATGAGAPPPAQARAEPDAAFRSRRRAWGEALTRRVVESLAAAGDPGTLTMLRRAARGESAVCDAASLPAPRVNASLLVEFLSRLDSLGMRPGFEVMGWPSSLTTDMDNTTQACLWSGLVAQSLVAVRDALGADKMRQYRLEGWNEVNQHGDFDHVTVSTESGIHNMWDATAAAVDAVLGRETSTLGALSIDRWTPMPQAHLAHMANGTSLLFPAPFTVRRGDFLAWHSKGDQTAYKVMVKQAVNLAELLAAHPEIVRQDGSSDAPAGVRPWALPLVNDESDPEVEWDHTLEWRADTRYPAMMAGIVAQNLDQWSNFNASGAPQPRYPGPGPDPFGSAGVPFAYLAFDAAFMNVGPTSFFQFRSFTTRFMMNHTSPRGVETIRKPALNVMAPLALLGDRQLPVTSSGAAPAAAAPGGSAWPPGLPNVTAIVSKRAGSSPVTSDEIAVLVIASHGADDTAGRNVTFRVTVEGAGAVTRGSDPRAAVYAVHDRPTDPAAVWAAAGSPPFPSPALLAAMRAGGEIAPVAVTPVEPGSALYFNSSAEGLPATGVYVLHACAKPASGPPAPPGVPFARRSTLNAAERFVKWQDSGARCLASYEVQVSADGGPWADATGAARTVSLVWLHLAAPGSATAFRVRAVDYWGRASPWSRPSAAV